MNKILPTLILLALTSHIHSAEKELDCTKAFTTPDINHCEYLKVVEAEKVLQAYIDKSVKHYSTEKEFDSHMNASQETWLNIARINVMQYIIYGYLAPFEALCL